MKIGDEFVFIGKEVEDSHFKNFEYGKHYVISSISDLPDGDSYGNYCCIMFSNCNYGCIDYYFDRYFVTSKDFSIN